MSRLGTFSLPVLAPRRRPRRGVLLLVCLSMLTLFMLLGTTYMVVTSRARATARAFARSSSQQFQAGGGDGQRLLDEALLAVVRGQAAREDIDLDEVLDEDLDGDKALTPAAIPAGDDLLGDRYGLTLSPVGGASSLPQFLPIRGGITAVDQSNLGSAAVRLRVGFDGSVPAAACHPAVLAGRVFTLMSPGLTWSTRILRAEGATTARSLIVGLDSGSVSRRVSFASLQQAVATGDVMFLINGREFTPPRAATGNDADPLATNEPYDGFDDENPFLAKVVPIQSANTPFDGEEPTDQVGTVECQRASFRVGALENRDIDVDNDLDGVPDSIWLDLHLPVQQDGAGGYCKPLAAVLVLDLDSRVNANLHGTLEELDALEELEWPTEAESFPSGSGYGPPEVRISEILDTGSSVATLQQDLRALLTGGIPETKQGESAKRQPPALANARGRYGESGKPGRTANDALSDVRDQRRGRGDGQQAGRPPFMRSDWLMSVQPNADAFASPHDLKGVMKVFASASPAETAVVTSLQYAKPILPDGSTPWMTDCDDDPYEIRPGQDSADDALFGSDELERILRVYDWDVAQLPPRLAAVLGPHAERLRMLLTTEQWDTTAIVGDAWPAIEKRICEIEPKVLESELHDLIAPELLGGRRFDLNRPVTSQVEAERYCRGLYTLLWFLADDALAEGGSSTGAAEGVAQEIAQWAVNVLDFRDADSVMTRFEYDRNPLDGWTPADDDVVWGVERPEMVITEAVAWTANNGQEGGVSAMLHRPWHTENFLGSQSLSTVPGARRSDRVDPLLDADPERATNDLDLAALGGGDAKSPVWRLRAGENTIIRFDNPNPGDADPDECWSSQAANRTLSTNGWASVSGSAGTPIGGTVTIDNQGVDSEFQIDRPAPPKPAAGETEITLVIERLADPSRPHDPDDPDENPYLAIDSLTVAVADRSPNPAAAQEPEPIQSYAKQSRDLQAAGGFWARPQIVPPAAPYAGQDDSVTVGILRNPGGQPAAWLPFLNRPLTSIAELALVSPKPSEELLAGWLPPAGNGMLLELARQLNITAEDAQRRLIGNLLAATTIPSRFAGVSGTADYSGGQQGGGQNGNPFVAGSVTGLDQVPDGQFDRYREPGRVNLNTVTDERIWNATVLRGPAVLYSDWPDSIAWENSMLGGKLDSDSGGSASAAPAKTMLDLLGLSEDAPAMVNDTDTPGPDPALNPQFHYLTANRLANVATNRSHVFAIWVTVGFFECTAAGGLLPNANTPRELGSDTGQIRRHRAFYIVDRSIPVAYETGRDHNVRDIIRLRRIIQ